LQALPLPSFIVDREGKIQAGNASALALMPDKKIPEFTFNDTTVEEDGSRYWTTQGKTFKVLSSSTQGPCFVQLAADDRQQTTACREIALALMGRLSMSCCHEIGQACNIIMNASLLAVEDDTQHFLEQIAKESERIAAVVQLFCSILPKAAPASFYFNRILRETKELIMLFVKSEGIQVDIRFHDDGGKGTGNGGELRLVLLAVFCLLLEIYPRKRIFLEGRSESEDKYQLTLHVPQADGNCRSRATVADMNICRDLVTGNGGSLETGEEGNGGIAVRIIWPRKKASIS
jgi:hypothetical protein